MSTAVGPATLEVWSGSREGWEPAALPTAEAVCSAGTRMSRREGLHLMLTLAGSPVTCSWGRSWRLAVAGAWVRLTRRALSTVRVTEGRGLHWIGAVLGNVRMRRAMVGVFVTRLAQAMYALALLLMLQQRFRGLEVAGIVVSAFTLAVATGGPLWGRLIDRRGPIVLAGCAVAGPMAIVGLVLIAQRGPVGALVAVAVVAGALQPPASSALRALIADAFGDLQVRDTAYSLDTIGTEVCFILGPAAVGACVAVGTPQLGLLTGAVLTLCGTLLFLAAGRSPVDGGGSVLPLVSEAGVIAARSPSRGIVWVISSLAFLQFLSVGMVEVGAVARASELGTPAASGLLLTTWAVGSVSGGFVQSIVGWTASPRLQYTVLTLSTAAGFAILTLAHDLVSLVPLMFVAGVSVAPVSALTAAAVGVSAPANSRTEAFTWVNSANAAGGSAGYLLAGVIAQHWGARSLLLTAAAVLLLGLAGVHGLPSRSRSTSWHPLSGGLLRRMAESVLWQSRSRRKGSAMSSSLKERNIPVQILGPDVLAEIQASTSITQALPGSAYTSSELFEWERDRVFGHGWTPVGRTADFAGKGTQTAVLSAGRNIVIVGAGDSINVFVNACRHRGHELVAPTCTVRRAQVWCAYHAWVYKLDGELRSAPRFEQLVESDPVGMGLLPVRSAEWNGWLFVNHSGTAPDLAASLGNLTSALDAYQLDSLRMVHRAEYEVEANWKLIVENYLECYHCSSTHPELSRVQRTVNGEGFASTGLWLGGSLDLKNSASSMSLDGSGPAWTFPRLDEDRVRQVCYYAVLPGLFVTAMHDYVVMHRLDPMAVDRTRVVCEWYFADELLAVEGVTPDYAIDFWSTTNLQDWAACVSTQRGVSDPRYVAGPLASHEEELCKFLKALADAYRRDAALRSVWHRPERAE